MSYQHLYLDGTSVNLPVGKIVCVGRNYAEHAKELNDEVPTEPLLFMKPSTAIVDYKNGFSIPKDKGSVHHEIEIAILIGKTLSGQVDEHTVKQAIAGFAPSLDLTLRDLQTELKNLGYPWEKCKSFDGSCVLTPFLPTTTYPDLNDIDIRFIVNGKTRQQGNSKELVVAIIPLIQYIANIFTLLPGDVVLTGTPKGVGPLQAGDQLIMALPDHSHFETHVL